MFGGKRCRLGLLSFARHPISGSTADLKFLRHHCKVFSGTSNRSGPRIDIFASALSLPKYVKEVAAMVHELRKRSTRTCAHPVD